MKKIFLSLSLLFISAKGICCICPTPVSIDSAFIDSEIIFRGEVIEIFANKFYSYQGRTTTIVNFQVTKNYKKTKVNGGIISLVDYRSSCDFNFELGKEYIVFAYDIGGGHYFTSTCTPTSLVSKFDRSDLEQLEELSANYDLSLYNYVTAFVIDKTSWDQMNADLKKYKDRIVKLERRSWVWMILSVVLGIALIGSFLWQRKKGDNKV